MRTIVDVLRLRLDARLRKPHGAQYRRAVHGCAGLFRALSRERLGVHSLRTSMTRRSNPAVLMHHGYLLKFDGRSWF